ncbi:uncharacterized protein [Epargyreus clarus]|uniref:uncharacterized protein n=1 Tax=Epargyreus clarus TaxID=520877 RepID=UPI003C2BFC18
MYRCGKLSLTVLFGCSAALFSLVQCDEYNKDKYSVGLFAAFAVGLSGKREHCMGTCYENNRKNQVCQVGRKNSDVGTNCTLSDEFVARYYTVYNNNQTRLCMSDCSNFSGSSKKWCVTDTNWNECTTEIPRRLTRNSAKDSHSSGVVYVADNPTDAGTRCVTPCAATDHSMLTFKCHDTKNKLVNCYPSPDTTIMVQSFHKYASKRPYNINDKDQLFACPVKPHGRPRRQVDDVLYTRKLEQIFNGINTVGQMATLISQWYPVETLRRPDPNIYPDPSTEPIIEYAVHILPAVDGGRQAILPMMVRAIYSINTLATSERGRFDEVNYARQNPRPQDDHGHLIGHALGGTKNPYNIVPQSRPLNRGGPWSYLERIMRNYINSNPRGTIEHIIVVNYDFTVSYRPTCFAIRVRFYNEHRELVNQYGHRLNSFAENIYENFYLINENNPCGT